MLKNHGALTASLVVSLFSVAVACSSSSDSPAPSTTGDAGADSGGAAATAGNAGAVDMPGAAGAPDASTEGGAAGEPSMSSGGTSGVAGSVAGSAGSGTLPAGPCTFAVTGGKTFPDAGSKFACGGTSRVYQQKGMGSFDALFAVSAYSDAKGSDISTIGCDIDSAVAPKAGDTWTMGEPEHPGNCSISLIHASAGTAWQMSSTSVPSGTASITFVSATLTHGMYKPEDVYYLYELNVKVTFTNQQGGSPDVTLTGHVTGGVPLGG